MSKTFGMSNIMVAVRFKAGDHFPVVRRKHFTVTEMFAFTGGLLGLFLGISVVTFAEIVNVLLRPLFKKLSLIFCSRKKQSRGEFKTNRFFEGTRKAKSFFSFFLKESSIHSFNFVANADNCLERIFLVSDVHIFNDRMRVNDFTIASCDGL